MSKKDLKFELLVAEHDANNKKRKAEGKPEIEFEHQEAQKAIEQAPDSESNKRRKILEDALEMDKDDEDENEQPAKDKDSGDKSGDEKEDDDDNDRYTHSISLSHYLVLLILFLQR